jgi:hypothetical protein
MIVNARLLVKYFIRGVVFIIASFVANLALIGVLGLTVFEMLRAGNLFWAYSVIVIPLIAIVYGLIATFVSKLG